MPVPSRALSIPSSSVLSQSLPFILSSWALSKETLDTELKRDTKLFGEKRIKYKYFK